MVQLSHPHIVKIQDVGREDDVPFAVMQFLEGGSLEGRRPLLAPGQPGAMHPATLHGWLRPICQALDFIHQRGFVHRDLKPANLLFDGDGNAYLSDFGVAKAIGDRERQTSGLTGTGMVLGTPEYMAPELIMGEAFDGRIDQYALAATIYELLCGHTPFAGPTPAAILVKHSTAAVPPPTRRWRPARLRTRPKRRRPSLSSRTRRPSRAKAAARSWKWAPSMRGRPFLAPSASSTSASK